MQPRYSAEHTSGVGRWHDGSTHVVLDPMTLFERLSALVPTVTLLDCCAFEFDRCGNVVDWQRRLGGDCHDCC